jgi:hypothetical protein
MSAVRVLNLTTRNYQIYTCDPRSAVIAAHAQSLGDWNTWDYESKYADIAQEGKYSWNCGNFSALKETKDDKPSN